MLVASYGFEAEFDFHGFNICPSNDFLLFLPSFSMESPCDDSKPQFLTHITQKWLSIYSINLLPTTYSTHKETSDKMPPFTKYGNSRYSWHDMTDIWSAIVFSCVYRRRHRKERSKLVIEGTHKQHKPSCCSRKDKSDVKGKWGKDRIILLKLIGLVRCFYLSLLYICRYVQREIP